MGNMGYCRFQNTLGDLQDCYDNWGHPEEVDPPNEDEIKAKKKMLKLCERIVKDKDADKAHKLVYSMANVKDGISKKVAIVHLSDLTKEKFEQLL